MYNQCVHQRQAFVMLLKLGSISGRAAAGHLILLSHAQSPSSFLVSASLPPLLPALVLSDPQLGGAGPDRDRAALIMICDGMDIRDTFSVCLETYTHDNIQILITGIVLTSLDCRKEKKFK